MYSVGIFRTYADALGHLNKVKGRGFTGAMIVAFENGKLIPIPQARSRESQVRSLFNVRIYPEDGHTLPEKALDACIKFALTDELYVGERYHDANPWYYPWSPNASGSGRLTLMLLAEHFPSIMETHEKDV